jgi:cytochrome c peroxidase
VIVMVGVAGCEWGFEAAPDDGPPALVSANAAQAAVVGIAFSYDATKGGSAFSDPSGRGLTYTVALTAPTLGLTAADGRISGVPASTGVVQATVTAIDKAGHAASQDFAVAVFAPGLRSPSLPATLFSYTDAANPFPQHFVNGAAPGGPVLVNDNTPPSNPITDAGATLGRVLFYDTRLSANDKVSCASCHLQSLGFADSARFSHGFAGALTGRHAPGLANARFYLRGRFFWDERAVTLENQVLQPIQNSVEMGLTLDALVAKLSATTYYPALFSATFGSTGVTSDRVSRALAQFVRSLRSTQSRFDASIPVPPPGPAGTPLSPLEQQGLTLFNGAAGCAPCHATNAQISDNIHNTGLDSVITDVGAGNGRFKAPSLRNVALRPQFMHDGRFTTLQQVVSFYDSGVKNSPALDGRLRSPPPDGSVKRLNLTQGQRDAIVAYLTALTDSVFIATAKLSSPFPP